MGKFEITAYTLHPSECGKPPSHPEYGITASGAVAKKYRTIAAPCSIPFGTKLYIPALKDWPNKGIFVVEDRGGAITEGRLDIYFGDPVKEYGIRKKAFKWGRKELEVYIVKE